jgi:glycerol-1-phosphate dehydrogenase [NAD(P)+]
MEVLFAGDLGSSDVERACGIWPDEAAREREVREALGGTPIVEQAVETCLEKHVPVEILRRRLTAASRSWTRLARRAARQLLPFDRMRDMLQAAGCPVRPEQIGVERDRLEDTFRLAQMIRPRYTVLDLAYETGRLRECTERVFSSSRYFP